VLCNVYIHTYDNWTTRLRACAKLQKNNLRDMKDTRMVQRTEAPVTP
jgi:hypothetical protein